MSDPSAEYFDRWYAAMAYSPRTQQIQQSALGLPAELESTSLVPWDGIADLVAALGVRDADPFVDLACGRGGYGLEIARRTGARLVGVDFSAVAIEQATTRAAELWAGVASSFVVGQLTATGLDDASAVAVLCIDAMQFADPYDAGIAECLRILAPGGRLVVTGWQALDPDDAAVPERLHRDIGGALESAGFVDVDVREMTAWRRAERALWELASGTDAAGDPAVESMQDEARRVLPVFDAMRRLLVTGRAPGRPRAVGQADSGTA